MSFPVDELLATYSILGRYIQLSQKLGSGSSGEVWLANVPSNAQQQPLPRTMPFPIEKLPPLFAVKIIRYSQVTSPRHLQLIQQEVATLKALAHPHAVKYYGCWMEQGNDDSMHAGSLCIATEHCAGGDLRRMINSRKEKGEHFTNEAIMWIAAQLLSGAAHCHAKKIIHRDIKPANIFVRSGGDGVLLGDFGLSRQLDHSLDVATSRVGTSNYCSPQVVLGETYTGKTDVWSIGVVLFEAMTLQRPFFSPTNTDRQVFDRILREDPLPTLRALCEGQYNNTLINIVDACLSKTERNRPTAVELLTTFSVTMNTFVKDHGIQLPNSSAAEQPSNNTKPKNSSPPVRRSSPVPERKSSPLRGGGLQPQHQPNVALHHVNRTPLPATASAQTPAVAPALPSRPTSPIKLNRRSAVPLPSHQPSRVSATPGGESPAAVDMFRNAFDPIAVDKVSSLLSSLLSSGRPETTSEGDASPPPPPPPLNASALLNALHNDEELFLLVKVMILARQQKSLDVLGDGLFKLLVALRPEVDADKVIQLVSRSRVNNGG